MRKLQFKVALCGIAFAAFVAAGGASAQAAGQGAEVGEVAAAARS
jgi:hypothetical protein